MKIYSIQTFSGRNIYSHKPVMKMVVDICDLHKSPTKDIAGFNDRLLELFPGLKKHHCALGYEGGFAERLNEGTYMGHVLEHLIIEMQSLAGYEIAFGKARIVSEPSLYYVVFQYINEKCGIECAKAAAEIIEKIVSGEEINAAAIIDNIKRISVESELGPSTGAIFAEAKKRGIPATRIGSESLIQLGYGKYSRLVQASLTDATSCITADVAGNKQLTKQILMDNEIPVPYGDIAYTEQQAAVLASSLGYPVVVKPFDSNQGKGVALGLISEEQVRKAFHEAMKFSRAVMVEKYVKGRDYRVLVIGNRVSAVSERRPPAVTGDGIHSIRELVEAENRSGLRGNDHEKPLTKIKLDSTAVQVLDRKGLDENSIPAEGETVLLRDNGNLSTGGTARSCTGEIHPENAAIAVRAARLIGLDIAGIDMIAEDISRPLTEGSGAIIEINAAPGLRMHLYPTEGEPSNVAADILDMLYPEDKPFTVPIVSITGTNGKTTTTRLIRHTLSLMGKKVGMTSTSGVYIGDECILKGDNTGPVSARMVLSNKEVEAAVLETARGGIVRRGLGYDLADVGVVVNISEDHLGVDSLNTLEDLAFVKSLVVEAVKPEGYAILNADDRMTGYMLGRVKSKVMLFSSTGRPPVLEEHIASGGRAAYISGNALYLHDRGKSTHLIDLDKIPITIGGTVECNIENSLAAVCALYCIEVPVDIIKMGLLSFKPDLKSNPGRFNIFDMGDFKVMLDYGHNPAGYSAVLNFIQKIGAERYIGVIGMPGDRPDRSMAEVGEMCAKVFHRIYIKEDEDLRGRKDGEVAGIFYDAIVGSGMKKENVEIVLPELKALETAMLDAQHGDLIVMFYEKFEPAVELIERFRQEMDDNVIRPRIVVEEAAG